MFTLIMVNDKFCFLFAVVEIVFDVLKCQVRLKCVYLESSVNNIVSHFDVRCLSFSHINN